MPESGMQAQVRKFDTGATRDLDTSKLDFEGFLSPLVLTRYAEYMHANRMTAEGLRDSDNWQRGIPLTAYMKSAWRHFMDWWRGHRGIKTGEDMETALCALIFNASGYLHELLKARLGMPGKGTNAPDFGLDESSADAHVETLLPPGSAPGEE